MRLVFLLFALLGAFALSSPAPAEILFLDFGMTEGLNLVGSAETAGAALRLTTLQSGQRGACWLEERQNIEDGFVASFEFQITGPFNNFGPADGLAFVIQNSAVDAIGNGGGGLGYQGIPSSLAIEFQTFIADHISVHSAGTRPNSPGFDTALDTSERIPELADESVHSVDILYTPGSLEVFLDATLHIDVDVDMQQLLALEDGTAWIGFTAATGGGVANHDVLRWYFESIFDPEFRRGDTDGSGDLGIGDPIRLLNHLFLGGSLECQDAADANDDGNLNIGDAVGLLTFLFQGGIAPPAPGAECGEDPTGDSLTCEGDAGCF